MQYTDDQRLSPDVTVIVDHGAPLDACASKVGLLDLLRSAPHLLQICSARSALKDLRAVCREIRTGATSHISTLAVDCEQPITASHLRGVVTLLDACSLRCLCVKMHLEHHGEQIDAKHVVILSVWHTHIRSCW